ncbi:MMPL family transporter [Nocardioides euryhalodurans]|uniref:MMPL family transporter n=1 Tax=Nocardioides euryhalodurans TaxID=2518370 RepID=A0A4P7GIL5_9ACTN|nr:MMPL family transporter [Nocardioides euryhalodurans]QBR91594.1 MMPL family transporter [Nocardioides euryhalodurans]
MASLLHRLGRFGFRRRGLVAATWLVLLTALGGSLALAGTAPTSTITIPGTESQQALDALAEEFPQASGASGTVVLRAPEGETVTDAANRETVLTVVQRANELPGVVGATSPFDTQAVSEDGRYALVSVQYADAADALTEEERSAYEEVGADAPDGWAVAAGGEPLMTEPEIGSTEAIGVAVALLVLVITFGSMVAAGMTMLNALVGVGAGMLGLLLVGHVADLTSVTPVLALMLGLAVGIDYSLFITSRYRHNIAIGLDREEAAGQAVGTAGSAVVFAGLTVIIALAGLAVVGIPFLTSMGLAAAGTVAVAVLVAVTLLPAVLGFAGDRVLSRRQRRADGRSGDLEDADDNGGFRWGRLMVRRRVPVLLAGIAALGVLAIPTASMQLALPDDGTAPEGTSKREAYDLVAEGFGEGFNGRLLMVVHGSDQAGVQQAGVQQAATEAGEAAAGVEGVLAVAPGGASPDGRTVLLGVVPESGPSQEATFDLVRDVRGELSAVADRTGSEVSLTGVTAVGVDVSEKLAAALPVYLLVVVGLSFVLLMIVFRSVLVPLKATLGFLLTVGATFGATVAIFQWGWLSGLVGLDTGGPLVSFLPILLIGILFGLAMDYEVFLVSRMREDFVHGETAREAIVSGVGHGARVVVAAALIMVSVFAGFMLVDDPIIKSMGFALAFGVLVDAFVVRLSLVPAVMSFLDDRAWWLPRWLDRLLPDVDLEGESLRRGADTAAEPQAEPAAR